MPDPKTYLESVETIWLIWLGASLTLVWLTIRLLRRRAPGSMAAVLREEDGAAYSLAYVMTVPFFVFLVCLVVETTIVLLGKMGTVYAAYAAVRAHVVYRSLETSPQRLQERTRRAAVRALVPFASSSSLHADGQQGLEGREDSTRYIDAARRWVTDKRPDAGTLRAQYAYADKTVAVTTPTKDPPSQPDGVVTLKVSFQVPLHVPGVGRLLGRRSPRGGPYWVADVSTTMQLPDEAPRTSNQRLGINYGTPD